MKIPFSNEVYFLQTFIFIIMAKHVIYFAGNLLVIQTIVVLAVHVIEEEKKVIRFPKNKQVANLPGQKQQFRTQQGVKRTCGAAQKSVRIKKKNSTQKKD